MQETPIAFVFPDTPPWGNYPTAREPWFKTRPWRRETPAQEAPPAGATLPEAAPLAGDGPEWPPIVATFPDGPGTWLPPLEVAGEPTETRYVPLWWQLRGLSYTASGYGSRIPTSRMVRYGGRWRRVYCCIFSNSGTCYIDGPLRKPGDNRRGKRERIVVSN